MFKYIVDSANNGNNWMALLPLVFFVIVFVVSVVRTMTRKKDYIDKMSNLPFEDSKSKISETN